MSQTLVPKWRVVWRNGGTGSKCLLITEEVAKIRRTPARPQPGLFLEPGAIAKPDPSRRPWFGRSSGWMALKSRAEIRNEMMCTKRADPHQMRQQQFWTMHHFEKQHLMADVSSKLRSRGIATFAGLRQLPSVRRQLSFTLLSSRRRRTGRFVVSRVSVKRITALVGSSSAGNEETGATRFPQIPV